MGIVEGYRASIPITYIVQTGANIAPFFVHDFTDVYHATNNPNGYWNETPTRITVQSDGWAHVVMDNTSGTGAMYAYMRQIPVPIDLDDSEQATLLLEVRNIQTNAATNNLWLNPCANALSGKTPALSGATINFNTNGEYRQRLNVNRQGTIFANWWFAVSKGKKASFDARLSVYQGAHKGAFEPYVEVSV